MKTSKNFLATFTLIGMLLGASIMIGNHGITASLGLAIVWSLIEGIKVKKVQPQKYGQE